MNKQEILEELRSTISGRTFDALLPPILFALINAFFDLTMATVGAFLIAACLGIFRFLKKQNWFYALGGFLAVSLAASFAYFTGSAANYFVGSLIGSAFVFFVAFISLVIGKPLAAWLSHLTRGWPLSWFWRKDVKPAYREVTWIWTILLLFRFFVRFFFFQRGSAVELAWINTLSGWPLIVPVLILSYIYGIWRLRNLKGPGVEEYQRGEKPPWKGQTRGF